MNDRRLVLKSVGATARAVPLTALAQTAGKVWRVGILPGGLLASRKFLWDAFRERMHQLGYVEGKNVLYEFRPPAMEGAPFDELAADLVRLKVDVIVATTGVAVRAAKKATPSIPIVMSPASDAVGLGLIASLARPGGNVTGVELQFEETTGKRLQLLREMVPKAARIAFCGTASVKGNGRRPPWPRGSLACACKAWKWIRPKRCRARSRPQSRSAPRR